ncbi:Regulatory protein, TetR [Nostocoides japonicum T1-X7]|uniref:Regulatory protein, TetR n=1 Tax=Nostocoides japonicum T1-X7 TaxID=1194083 RepID=A0A077M477_9MICO|nr:TetR/AcrR family transcriptional regulator [Tetrasphaera japonica]CCH79897.1 Regulatory protein, TetR [Tetrasphaera japonica T1-X7]
MAHPVTRRRRRTPDAADVRRRILDAATELFARDGFDATATSSIARAAGVPKGLLFYHFPAKLDLLRTLLDERLPTSPLCGVDDVVVPGDIAASLERLHAEFGLDQHESLVLRTVIFREAQTHPEVGDHLRRLRAGMVAVTEAVLDGASPEPLAPDARQAAARTFVAVVVDHANAERFGGAEADIAGAARLVAGGLRTAQHAR